MRKNHAARLIAGLIEPDSGEIYIGDKRVDDVPPEDREIGFVFQTFALFPHMTVWENVIYGPRVKNFDLKEAEPSVMKCLNWLSFTNGWTPILAS